jgi:hypothetical protein
MTPWLRRPTGPSSRLTNRVWMSCAGASERDRRTGHGEADGGSTRPRSPRKHSCLFRMGRRGNDILVGINSHDHRPWHTAGHCSSWTMAAPMGGRRELRRDDRQAPDRSRSCHWYSGRLLGERRQICLKTRVSAGDRARHALIFSCACGPSTSTTVPTGTNSPARSGAIWRELEVVPRSTHAREGGKR